MMLSFKKLIPSNLYVDFSMGFCIGMPFPGQYCVPGSPEVGIICPQGILIKCRRPKNSDPVSWSDTSPKMERCAQMNGLFPPLDLMNSDPFRKRKVSDVFGRTVLRY